MTKTEKVLTEARDLLAQRGRWIKGSWRRYLFIGRSLRAVECYCADGALLKAAIGDACGTPPRGSGYARAAQILNRLARQHGAAGLIDFNDRKRTRKKDVLALFDEAIAQVQS